MRKFHKISIACLVVGTMALQACSRENVADNTVDATIFVGKTAVKGVVGAGKLAVKGTKSAVRKYNTPSGFAPGTAICTDSDGIVFEAPQNAEGVYFCPQ